LHVYQKLEETALLKGLTLISREGDIILFETTEKQLRTEEFMNRLSAISLTVVKEFKPPLMKKRIDSHHAHIYKLDDMYVGIMLDSDRIGSIMLSSFLAEYVRNILKIVNIEDRKEVTKLRKKLSMILDPRKPKLSVFLNLLRKIINEASREELIKYSLSLYSRIEKVETNRDALLAPYKVVNFDDGIKRALAAAFYGDLIEAFRLALGALQHKWDNMVALFAAYIGLKLQNFPSDYAAPSFKLIKKLLKKVKPKTSIETILLNYLKLAEKAYKSYLDFLRVKIYLREHVDEIFDVFRRRENVYQTDILAFILSTVDPTILTRKKIDDLHNYIGERSHILGSYLKSAISRLRSFTMIGARDLYVRDALGYIRLVRSRYLNARSDLIELLARGIEYVDRKVREIFITYISALTDYLRSIYYSFSIRDINFESVKSLVNEALRETIEGLKIIIEKPPQIPLDALFEPIEYAGLIIFYSEPYLSRGEAEEIMRGILNLMASFYILLKKNAAQNRLGSWWITRLSVLLWLSALFTSKISDFQPFIVPLARDIITMLKKKRGALAKAGEESYALILMTLIATLGYLSSLLPEKTRVTVTERLSEDFLNTILWILSTRIYQIPLIASLVDSLLTLLETIDFESKDVMNRYLITLAKGLLRENIGNVRKRVIRNRVEKMLNMVGV